MTTFITVTGAVVLVGLLVVALLFGGIRRTPEEQAACDADEIEALWGAEEALDAIGEQRRERET